MPRKRPAPKDKISSIHNDKIEQKNSKKRKLATSSDSDQQTVQKTPIVSTSPLPLETVTAETKATTDSDSHSDNSIIEILSDNEQDHTQPKKARKVARIAGSNVSIEKSDLKYLKPRKWLNDTIVDFVLQMYLNEYQMQSEIYISNSFFYSRLSQMSQNEDQSAFDSIKRWVQYKEIFDKRLWLIPACENYHWYLIAVVNPGKKKQFIVIMDSLNRCEASGKAPLLIKDFLNHKYLQENGRTIPPIKILVRHIPTQENSYDCGLHLFRSVQLLMLHRSKTLDMFRGRSIEFSQLWEKTPVPDRKELKQKLSKLIKFKKNKNKPT